MRIYGFKYITLKGAESFYGLLSCDGTIGAMHDHSNEDHIQRLLGGEEFDYRTFMAGEDDDTRMDALMEAHEELCDARWGLLMAFCQGVDNIHMCPECHHVSSLQPCSCGKGKGFTKLYSLDWAMWNIFGLDMAKSWLEVCFSNLGHGFHPDTRGKDLLEDGAPLFNEEEAEIYDLNMEKCFELFKEAGEDIYDWCLKNLFND